IDECAKGDVCGDGGTCSNVPGHYKCECHPGYRRKGSRPPLCEDINECLDAGTCPDSKCENHPGGFVCTPCPPGFRGLNGACLGQHPRDPPQTTATPPKIHLGSPKPPRDGGTGATVGVQGPLRGHAGVGTPWGHHIDECAKGDVCGDGGTCSNVPGHYKCECHPGYRRKGSRPPLCEDINECLDAGTCPDSKCENHPGGFVCTPCPPGFRGLNGACLGQHPRDPPQTTSPMSPMSPCHPPDINECLDAGTCPDSKCENHPGGFVCTPCPPGFRGLNGACLAEFVALCPDGRGFIQDDNGLDYGVPAHR
ncbi:latent-transforming growth factor beta-binding protein 3-like, partial [Passer montanus]|uniref:latent-transforming growth factor beta-binding protein 3-like n=1 Tax=Passer montanus TaxID=9160 RepID=UPI001961594C